MRSRMGRYYSREEEQKERTKKNQELYDTVYNMEPLKIVGTIDNLNEINLEEIENTFKSREEYRKVKEYKKVLNQTNDEYDIDYEEQEQSENKIYDINSVLEKAKTERGMNESDDKYRKLRNTQYNILSNLNINDYASEEEEKDPEDQLRDLIHTITMKKAEFESIKSNEEENLLDDLMPTSNTVITEAASDQLTSNEVDGNIDKSFYSSFYDFTKEDFEDSKKVEPSNKVSKVLIKLLLFIVIVIVTVAILFVINNYLNIEIF
ncbi:MAG: hypothetical protein PHS45_01685 [Bacilli bacterium]|nr:hypothetical protein [Bacilli bacterium]